MNRDLVAGRSRQMARHRPLTEIEKPLDGTVAAYEALAHAQTSPDSARSILPDGIAPMRSVHRRAESARESFDGVQPAAGYSKKMLHSPQPANRGASFQRDLIA